MNIKWFKDIECLGYSRHPLIVCSFLDTWWHKDYIYFCIRKNSCEWSNWFRSYSSICFLSWPYTGLLFCLNFLISMQHNGFPCDIFIHIYYYTWLLFLFYCLGISLAPSLQVPFLYINCLSLCFRVIHIPLLCLVFSPNCHNHCPFVTYWTSSAIINIQWFLFWCLPTNQWGLS